MGSYLNTKIYGIILNKNLIYHLNKNSSESINQIITETNRVTNSVIIQTLNILSKIIVTLFIISGLIIYNFKITVSIIFFITISYFIILQLNKLILTKNSKIVTDNNKQRQKILQESLANFREVIIFKNKNFFLNIFQTASDKLAKSIAKTMFISSYPRYLIEIIGFIFFIILIIINLNNKNNFIDIFPLIGIFFAATLKILPLIQGIASSYISIKSNSKSIESTSEILKNKEDNKFNFTNLIIKNIELIEIKNFSFKYDTSNIFTTANFKLKKGDFVGLYGPTGSGKSTFIDIFLGLKKINHGTYFINNQKINHDVYVSSILNTASIVPQKINLLDDTIENNIIFGREKIYNHKKKLEEIEKICLLDFIKKMPLKFQQQIGENGSILSGGQIQRLAFARALYCNPKYIVLDEATANLDKETEIKLIKNLIKEKNITFLMITHNESLKTYCTNILKLRNNNFIQIF